MLVILILAIFGNLAQLQLKYDHCKAENFKGEYCVIQEKLNKFSHNEKR
jgi:hypothetical protein